MGNRGGEDLGCLCGTETRGVWDERGGQFDHWQTLWPHICADKPGKTGESEADHATQRSSARK